MSFDPSSSVSSENNLSYLNQDNEIKPIVIRARRAPTTNDRRFKIGTLWVNQDTNQSYQLTSVSGGLANWRILSAGVGTAVLVAGTVTVANTSITATSRIFLTSQVDGGFPGWLRITATTVGTDFTITSDNIGDTSTVAWLIIEPA